MARIISRILRKTGLRTSPQIVNYKPRHHTPAAVSDYGTEHSYGSLHQHLLDFYKKDISFSSPSMSAEQAAQLAKVMHFPKNAFQNEEALLKNLQRDSGIFRTAWGNDPEIYLPFNARLFAGDPKAFNRLRLIYFYSGWPIVNYRHAESFPVIDPTFMRYLKTMKYTPAHLQFQAPDMCGEAGWRMNGGIVNHDVAIAQERLQFMHFIGAFDHMKTQSPKPVVVEIGAGVGQFALALSQSTETIDYYIIDVPPVLSHSFAYLSACKPDWAHDFVTPDGIIPTTNKDAKQRIIYVPFYLLPDVLSKIQPSLVLNFMSLHEMTNNQIAYYANTVAHMTRENRGIFLEFNSYRGRTCPGTFDVLSKRFKHFRRFEFISLGMVPTLWTNDLQALENASAHYEEAAKKNDFEALFQFDCEMEYPCLNDSQLQELLDVDLGKFVNCSITKWMRTRKLEHANHLRYHRDRMKEERETPSGTERFWHEA